MLDNTIRLSQSYLSYMDTLNDQGGIVKRLGAKGGLIASIVPSIIASLGHTFVFVCKLGLFIPIKSAVKIITFGQKNVHMNDTIKAIKSNFNGSIKFAVAAVALPIIAIISTTTAIKVGEDLGLANTYSVKWIKADKMSQLAVKIHATYEKVVTQKKQKTVDQQTATQALASLEILEIQYDADKKLKEQTVQKLKEQTVQKLKDIVKALQDEDSQKGFFARLYKGSNIQKIEATNQEIEEQQQVLESSGTNYQKQISKAKEDVAKLDNEIEQLKLEEIKLIDQYKKTAEETYGLLPKLHSKDLYTYILEKLRRDASFITTQQKLDNGNDIARSEKDAQMTVQAVQLRTLSMKIQAYDLIENGEILSDSSSVLIGIKNHFKMLPENKISNVITPNVLEKLASLKGKSYDFSIYYSGRDSLNRELLVRFDELKDPEVFLGICAIQAAKENGILLPNVPDDCLRIGGSLSLYEMLEYGLKTHPAILESMPLNIKKQSDFLDDQIKRKDINNTFVPVLKSLYQAHNTIRGANSLVAGTMKSHLSTKYQSTNWKEYEKVFQAICVAIDQNKNSGHSLLKNASSVPLDTFQMEVRSGFSSLMGIGSERESLTKQEIINFIASSPKLIKSIVSHLFYDRLHLIAALIGGSLTTFKTKEGEMSMRELFEGLVKKFSAEGVSVENAIASEQLFIRFMLLADFAAPLEDSETVNVKVPQ